MSALESVLKSIKDPETKAMHREKIEKATVAFNDRLAKRVAKNIEREAARSELEKALDAKKSEVVDINEKIKALRFARKTLQSEIRDARKAARQAD